MAKKNCQKNFPKVRRKNQSLPTKVVEIKNYSENNRFKSFDLLVLILMFI